MKKSSFFLLILLFLLISSCTSIQTEERFDTEDTQYDFKMEFAASGGAVIKQDNVYYIEQLDWLYYYDETSGTSGKLCAKPECAHDSNTCNAQLGYAVYGLQIYDGSLYWISGTSVWKMDMTGNGREIVQNLQAAAGTDPFYAIHRGYVYKSIIKNSVVDGEAREVIELHRYALGKDEPELVFSCIGDGLRFVWRPYRNKLYLMCESRKQPTTNYDRVLYEYDINKSEIIELWRAEDSAWFSTNFSVSDEGVQILGLTPDNDAVGNRSIQREFYSFEKEKMILEDTILLGEGYRFAGMTDEYIMIHSRFVSEDSPILKYKVLDWEGNIITEQLWKKGTRFIDWGGDETGFIVDQSEASMPDTEGRVSYIDYLVTKIPTSGEEPKVLLETRIMIG